MPVRRTALFGAIVAAVLILSACASGAGSDSPSSLSSAGDGVSDAVPPVPALDPARVDEGAVLYDQYCASCHRADLSGDPQWKAANADGSYPPPPHDISGHTWHHSDGLLLAITRDGTDLPESRMPRFGDTLSDGEIESIIEFLKSSWGSEERSFQWQVTWSEEQREEN